MKKVPLSLILLMTTGYILAQDKFSLYLDLGGASPIVSINFEKRIKKLSSVGFGYKLGVGLVGIDVEDYPRTYIKLKPSFPIGVNYLFGKENRTTNIEIAAQATFIPIMSVLDPWDPSYRYPEPVRNLLIPSLFVGYRIKPINKKGIIRIGYSPIFFKSSWISWFNLSLGWTAKKRR